MTTSRDLKNEARSTLNGMTIPVTALKELRAAVGACKIQDLPGIMAQAEDIEREFQADLKAKYADTLREARKAFLTDSEYGIAIAECANRWYLNPDDGAAEEKPANTSETHAKAPTRAVDRRDRFPEPRPVVVTYTEPRKPVVKTKETRVWDPDFRCPPEHKHETRSTCYASHGCRCDPCKEWMKIRNRKKHERRMKI